MKTSMKILSAAVLLSLTATQAIASKGEHNEFKVHSQDFVRALDVVNFSDGANYDTTITFTTGIGSGAYHYPGDDSNTVYTIGDRGVNIKCKDDVKVFGGDVCAKGKIFPVINYSPSIFKLQKQHKTGWTVTEIIQLKDADGKQISGLPNPFTSMATENAYDNKGNSIAFDANGLDTEAMIRLSDGSFWISEEYAPSLVHVSAAGIILERLVPAGIEDELSTANYPVKGLLPEILSKRNLTAVSNPSRYHLMKALSISSCKAHCLTRTQRLIKNLATFDCLRWICQAKNYC